MTSPEDPHTAPPVPGEHTSTDAVVLHEEDLHVGTRTRVSRKVRFRKVLVSEERTITVTVRHEELRVDDVPITDADDGIEYIAAIDRAADERIITLHAEVPVVTLETRPIEDVHVSVIRVSGQQDIQGTVRKEHLDLDGQTQ